MFDILIHVFYIGIILLSFFIGRKTSIFSYKRGILDGRLYAQALQQKAISSANTRLDDELSEKDLQTLANISRKH